MKTILLSLVLTLGLFGAEPVKETTTTPSNPTAEEQVKLLLAQKEAFLIQIQNLQAENKFLREAFDASLHAKAQKLGADAAGVMTKYNCKTFNPDFTCKEWNAKKPETETAKE